MKEEESYSHAWAFSVQFSSPPLSVEQWYSFTQAELTELKIKRERKTNKTKFSSVSVFNDATRYAQLLQERRKTAMTHTQSFVGEGFGEKYSEW